MKRFSKVQKLIVLLNIIIIFIFAITYVFEYKVANKFVTESDEIIVNYNLIKRDITFEDEERTIRYLSETKLINNFQGIAVSLTVLNMVISMFIAFADFYRNGDMRKVFLLNMILCLYAIIFTYGVYIMEILLVSTLVIIFFNTPKKKIKN